MTEDECLALLLKVGFEPPSAGQVKALMEIMTLQGKAPGSGSQEDLWNAWSAWENARADWRAS